MFTQPVGTRFTDSFELLRVEGDSTVVLVSVELVGGDGLRFLGFKLLGPNREATQDYFPSYPPKGILKALGADLIVDGPGAVLKPPHDVAGWELLVGLEITKPGPIWRDGLQINYTVEGKKYTAFFPAQIQVCTEAGPRGPGGKCRR